MTLAKRLSDRKDLEELRKRRTEKECTRATTIRLKPNVDQLPQLNFHAYMGCATLLTDPGMRWEQPQIWCLGAHVLCGSREHQLDTCLNRFGRIPCAPGWHAMYL